MTIESPIWPAQLDHLRLNSDDPAMLAGFYATALGFHMSDFVDGTYLLQGQLIANKPTKVAAVALANKMARIAWVLLMRGGKYRKPATGAA